MSSHSEHPAPPTTLFVRPEVTAGEVESDVIDWVMVTPEKDATRLFTLPALLFVLGSTMVLAAPRAHGVLAVESAGSPTSHGEPAERHVISAIAPAST